VYRCCHRILNLLNNELYQGQPVLSSRPGGLIAFNIALRQQLVEQSSTGPDKYEVTQNPVSAVQYATAVIQPAPVQIIEPNQVEMPAAVPVAVYASMEKPSDPEGLVVPRGISISH
jgi:hypothetical protein